MLTSSPCHERGDGQVSHLLLAEGQFGSQRLCVTWVECQPGSQQALHRHPAQEQVYVIIRGQGQMLVGGDERAVGVGTMVFVPPGAEHAIRNTSAHRRSDSNAAAQPANQPHRNYRPWRSRGLGPGAVLELTRKRSLRATLCSQQCSQDGGRRRTSADSDDQSDRQEWPSAFGPPQTGKPQVSGPLPHPGSQPKYRLGR